MGAGSGVVTDISSGKEMSLEEFDRALGLHTALEVRVSLLPFTKRRKMDSASLALAVPYRRGAKADRHTPH